MAKLLRLQRSVLQRLFLVLLVASVVYCLWHYEYYGLFPQPFRGQPPHDDSARRELFQRRVRFHTGTDENHLERLDVALARLSRERGLEISVDGSLNGLIDLEIAADDISLGALFTLIGEQAGTLSWAVDDGRIVFRSPPANLVTRTYPLGQLMATSASITETDLAELVSELWGPNTFDTPLAESVPLPGCLVVCGTPESHEVVTELLQRLFPQPDGPDPGSVAPWTLGAADRADDVLAERLEQLRGDFDYDDVPLHDVLRDIGRRFQIPLMIDSRRSTGDCVTLHERDTSVRTILALLPLPAGSAIELRHEALVLFANEFLAGFVRLYPVDDLLSTAADQDARALCDAISSAVEPQSWQDAGGPFFVSNVARQLVIRAPRRIHRQVATLLEELRRVRRGEPVPVADSPRDRIERALRQPATLDFQDLPWPEVSARLRRLLNERVYWSESLLDTPFPPQLSSHGKGEPLEVLLERMLAEADWTFQVTDLGLRVSTRDEASKHLETAVIRIPRRTAESSISSWPGDDWLDLAMEIVAPESWENAGGPGMIEPFGNCWIVANQHCVIAELRRLVEVLGNLSQGSESVAPVALRPVTSENAAIRAALRRPAAFDLRAVPLNRFAEDVAQRFQISVVLNVRALEGAGISDDFPLSDRIGGVSLEAALIHVLKPLQMVPIVRDGALMFTTEEDSRTWPRDLLVHLFPVGDLSRWESTVLTVPVACGNARRIPLVESQLAVLTFSWADDTHEACKLTAMPECLTVSALFHQQQQVDRFLRQLRQARTKPPSPWTVELAPGDETANARVQTRLAKPPPFAARRIRLGELLERLSEASEVPFRLAVAELADEIVDFPPTERSLEAALRDTLAGCVYESWDPIVLDLCVRHEAIVIDVRTRTAATRLYYVGDLAEPLDAAWAARSTPRLGVLDSLLSRYGLADEAALKFPTKPVELPPTLDELLGLEALASSMNGCQVVYETAFHTLAVTAPYGVHAWLNRQLARLRDKPLSKGRPTP